MPGTEKKYDKKLYKDIDRRMENMAEEEKAAFIMELAVLREMTQGEQSQAIDNHINAYMVPLNDDGELDKELFEQHIGILEKVRMERLCEPVGKFAFQSKQEHSEKWIHEYVNNATKVGVYQLNYQSNLMFGTFSDKVLANVIEQAYPEVYDGADDIYGKINLAKRKEILEGWPEEKKKNVMEGLRYFGYVGDLKNGKTEEELKEQEEKQKQDRFMDSNELSGSLAKATYTTMRDMDLSYVHSNKTYKKIQDQIKERSSRQRGQTDWLPERSVDRNMDELAANLESIKVSLKAVSGYRWRDSKEFNQIKDDLADLQEMLKKGSSKESREQIMKSLAKFSKDCKAYQEKNPGVRKTSRGNQRKELVTGIQGILDDQLQKIMAPEMEAEMKDVLARQNEKVARELAKDSLKREKVDVKDFLNEGRKSVPAKTKSKEKKEKEPELSRKSLEPERLKK